MKRRCPDWKSQDENWNEVLEEDEFIPLESL
jgi:hypothetical protein